MNRAMAGRGALEFRGIFRVPEDCPSCALDSPVKGKKAGYSARVGPDRAVCFASRLPGIWQRTLSAFPAVLALFLLACSTDPEVAKRRYLENGNKYFERGKYREASIMYRSALRKDRRYGEAYYRLGLAELKRRQIPAAVYAFRRAVELQPQNLDARIRLTDIYLVSYTVSPGKREEIATEIGRLLEQIFKIDPDSFDGYRIRGQLALLRRDFASAIRDLETAEKLQPGNQDVAMAACQAYERLGQFSRCEELAKAFISRRPDFEPLYDLLYQRYLREGRVEEASSILELKTTNNFKNLSNTLQLARHYLLRRRPDLVERTFERLLTSRHLYPDARRIIADFYAAAQDFDKALSHLQAGVKESKGEQKFAYQKRLVEVLDRKGDLNQAQRILDQLLREHPADPELKALRAALALSSGNQELIEREMIALQREIGRNRQHPGLHYQLARLLWDRGLTDRAVEHLQLAVRLNPNFVAAHLALAQLLLISGDSSAAHKHAAEAEKLVPLDPRPRWLLAEALLKQGRTAEALVELRRVVSLYPASEIGWIRYARGALEAKLAGEAEVAFRECLARLSSVACLTGLAETLAAQGRSEEGLQVLRKALASDPDNSQLRLAYADAVRARGHLKEALDLYRQLLASEPSSVVLAVRVGSVLLSLGRVQEALPLLERAVAASPRSPNAWHFYSLALHAAGKPGEALGAAQKLLQLRPEDPLALNNTAYLLAETGGDLDVALTYALRAKRLAPGSREISDTVGLIYLKKGMGNNAAEVYQTLVIQSPTDPVYRYRLALALFLKGEVEASRRELSEALRLKPPRELVPEVQSLHRKLLSAQASSRSGSV